MKKIIALLLTTLILTGQVQAQSFAAPDLLINTRLNSDWSGVLVNRVRRLMKNLGKPDPFSRSFEQPMIVSEAKVHEFLNPEARGLLTELGQLLKLDIVNSQTQITLHGLKYKVRGFKTDLIATEEKNKSLSVSSDFSASEIRVSADKVTLSLLIPGIKSLPVINIEVIKPIIIASENRLINFNTKIQIKNHEDDFKLFLEKDDFSNMASSLLSHEDAIRIDFDGIVVPATELKIGNKKITFDQKKIEALILSKKEGLKSLLMAQVSSFLTDGMGEDVHQAVSKVEFAKKYWIDSSPLQSMLNIDSFNGDEDGNTVEMKMDGDFCPDEFYKIHGEKCLQKKVTTPAKSRLTENNHQQSLLTIKSTFEHGDANIIVSISEDYVNKAILASYDAGLLNEMLKNAGLILGPNKIFIRIDEKDSQTGTLYADLIYSPLKLERMAIGSKSVRFPLVLQVGLNIKNVKGIPTFVIHVSDVDMTDKTLLNGKPEVGIPSNIHSLRLKNKVLATLRAEAKGLANSDVLEISYPELSGLGLDDVNFISDGNGRMNALMLFEEKSPDQD